MTKLVYCDGSCLGNPGCGGWAFFVTSESHVHSGSEPYTTNNRMELLAACRAIQYIGDCTLHTDSKYLMLGMTEWMSKWKTNGWKTSAKAPVKNVDLWQLLDSLVEDRNISWRWLKGHDPLNHIHNRVDEAARTAAMRLKEEIQGCDSRIRFE